MRSPLLLLILAIAACGSEQEKTASERPAVRIVHDTVHDTVWMPAKVAASGKRASRRVEASEDPASETRAATIESSVFTRCLAAARLQARAHDEAFGGYSALQDSARDANNVTICKLSPDIYLH
jgi:hypothetical protein